MDLTAFLVPDRRCLEVATDAIAVVHPDRAVLHASLQNSDHPLELARRGTVPRAREADVSVGPRPVEGFYQTPSSAIHTDVVLARAPRRLHIRHGLAARAAIRPDLDINRFDIGAICLHAAPTGGGAHAQDRDRNAISHRCRGAGRTEHLRAERLLLAS